MEKVVTRAYNTIVFNKDWGILRKSSKESRLADEANYYEALPDLFKIFFPRYIDSGIDGDEVNLRLEAYSYPNLGQLMTKGTFDVDLWYKIASHLKSTLDRFSEVTTDHDDEGELAIHEMTINKTEREYHALVDDFPTFTSLSKSTTLDINGKTYDNFHVIWDRVRSILKDHFITDTWRLIHGDLCFSNILLGHNPDMDYITTKFVDPRGSFKHRGCYGNPLYDLAKLRHSYASGYEYIIFDRYNLKYDDVDKIDFNFVCDNTKLLTNIFDEVLYENKLDTLNIIKMIEGCIYIGMCARHYDSLERQVIMYATGVKLLNESLNNI